MAVTNTGTATIDSLNATDPAYNGALSTSINFTDNAGGYNYALSDGTTGSGVWTAGSPISINGYELNLKGVPKSGDAISVKPTTSVVSNNGNALAFVGLGNARLVAAVGGASNNATAQTVTDAYASTLANIGVRVQAGQTASTISTAAANQADSSRSNNAGVNLDEEAAKLIQYQQSYQAAAKILQVAQQIFDSMLQMAAG
jgi:flagellar hook-associated protein 1 FlgK